MSEVRLDAAGGGYSGKVVYLYAFDVAYNMTRQPIRKMLGEPVSQFVAEVTKHSPRQLFFCRPEMVRLPRARRTGPWGTVEVERTVKLFPVGAISVAYHVPFRVRELADLAGYHDLRLDERSLEEEVRELAEEVRKDLVQYCVRPVATIGEVEAYTVFCIETPREWIKQRGRDQEPARSWFHENRVEMAAVLTEERGPEQLAQTEVEESTALMLSYHRHDLTVIDWNAAVMVDEPKNFAEILHVMELANVQLAELEAYDQILDDTLERSYRDLQRSSWRRSSGVIGPLREIRVDMARLSDELSNITKFFGDWHLARTYRSLSERFHLRDWHQTVTQKLRTLGDIYDILRQEQNNRWMLALEAAIVVLFVLDLAALILGLFD